MSVYRQNPTHYSQNKKRSFYHYNPYLQYFGYNKNLVYPASPLHKIETMVKIKIRRITTTIMATEEMTWVMVETRDTQTRLKDPKACYITSTRNHISSQVVVEVVMITILIVLIMVLRNVHKILREIRKKKNFIIASEQWN